MNGKGEYQWPDGTRYIGAFAQDRRSGLGILNYPDDSVFKGFFLEGRRHGMGVEEQKDKPMLLQRWQEGALEESQSIVGDPKCRAEDADGAWMVRADDCINGLAHGDGYAVTLTGGHLVPAGRWILGQRISGDSIELPKLPARQTQVAMPPSGAEQADTPTDG